MQKISLKNGYLLIPEDWIIVNPEVSTSTNYAAVIECRNFRKYNVPHFVYLNNIKYEKDYDDNFEKEFYKMCTTIWPQFKEIEKLSNSNQPIEDPDNKGKYLNIKEHLSAPIIGIFSIVEQNDMLTTEEAPYGAMIIRNS